MKSKGHWSARCDPAVGSQAIAALSVPFTKPAGQADCNTYSTFASQIPSLGGLEETEKGRSVETLHMDCPSVVILYCRAETGNTGMASHKPGEVL